VPSLALGAIGVSPLELTGAFASVRADRMGVAPWGIAAIGPASVSPSRAAGAPAGPARALDPYDRPLVDLLQGVIAHGTGRAAALGGFAAGKTGTSQNYRDAWFVGFNDALVVGVWLGNDDDAPMRHVVGGSLPAAIWKEFMVRASPLIGNAAVAAAPDAGATPTTGVGPVPESFAQASPGHCDIAACSAAYRSFRASDCTYQSYGGPRRACEIGGQPGERDDAGRDNTAAPRPQDWSQELSPGSSQGPSQELPQAPAQGPCNVEACARHYASFDASTCTYKPYDGGSRRLCEK